MTKLLFSITFVILVLSFDSYAKTTKEDCREHNSRCEAHCYDIYNNVKYKSDTTEKYLNKCKNICIRRKESCINRVEELREKEKTGNSGGVTSAIDEISQPVDNYRRPPNEIYKYQDDSGQYHVVDDIKKIPQKYRTEINE